VDIYQQSSFDTLTINIPFDINLTHFDMEIVQSSNFVKDSLINRKLVGF